MLIARGGATGAVPKTRQPNIHAAKFLARVHLVGSMRAVSLLGHGLLPRGRKARAVLAVCCLAEGQRVARSHLARLLWDRVPESQARASLRQALLELARAFDTAGVRMLAFDRSTVMLDPRSVWVDAIAVMNSVEKEAERTTADLLSLCNGRLLEELDGVSGALDRWLKVERARYKSAIYTVLQMEHDRAVGTSMLPAERADIARRLILVDPTHEGACRVLMTALAELGDRPAAIREFARCADALRQTLDIEPAHETVVLHNAIRAQTTQPSMPKPKPPNAARQAAPKSSASDPPGARTRLRIAVAPFMAMGSVGDPILPLALAQDVASALSRFRWFDVIMPVSLVTGGGQPDGAELLRAARDLHIDYALTGTLTRSKGQIRVGVQLFDVAEEMAPIWGDQLGLDVAEVAEFSERITSRIVARVDPLILFIEGDPNRRPRSTALEATQLVLRAIPMLYSFDHARFDEAGQMLRTALDRDPGNAMAAAWSAYWHLFNIGQGWSKDGAQSMRLLEEQSLLALRIDPGNAEAMGIYAHACSFLHKDFDRALHYFDRSLNLNPNLAFIWALSAPTYCYIGEPEEALRRLERYQYLAPHDPYFATFETMFTIAHLFLRDYAQAALVGRRAVRANPNFSNGYKPLIAALGHLGEKVEARAHLERLLALEPDFSIDNFAASYPFRRERDRRHYVTGLRKAGVRLK